MAKKTAPARSKIAKPARRAKPARTTKAAKPARRAKRVKWLDAKSQAPLIDGYARQMKSFLDAVADGVVEAQEVKEQERRLVALMKKVEPQLDDALHEQVTRLLCELTVYDIMQLMLTMSQARPTSRFHG